MSSQLQSAYCDKPGKHVCDEQKANLPPLALALLKVSAKRGHEQFPFVLVSVQVMEESDLAQIIANQKRYNVCLE